MSQPFVGEIRMFGGSFAPAGWAFCDGALQPIAENETLFNLIGTTYGGDGEETFGLPNLCGRTPIHQGQGPAISQTYQIGETGGVEQVTINNQTLPIHNHAWLASSATGTGSDPTDSIVSQHPTASLYAVAAPSSPMNASMLSIVGGSQPHENMQQYLCISYIISLFGIFPTQN